MVTRSRASEAVQDLRGHQHAAHSPWTYQVEVAADLLDNEGSLIDWLIEFAFATLDARHLDVRVYAPEP